ncbi:uncharacterized protein LOC132052559 isoform X2 [Lycium ferocissimum]|uniref:uncharacterized protein LOC132052559 isoform X2 n=1 Tax=Lycium ferocissimum TaxID=112874 RepID=UPI002815A446|nr:uncharacterized protein LOC132052559 isoform X2 [Lycium ferocissimum]
MDFHSLTRRELQALCKKNKIPANMTNVAMADALQSLDFVDGIEEVLKACESDVANSSMESPGKSEAVMSVPRTGRRTAQQTTIKHDSETLQTSTRTRCRTRGTVVNEVKNDTLETPALPTTRRRAATTNVCAKLESVMNECEPKEKIKDQVEEEKKDVPKTPAAALTSQRKEVKAKSSVRQVYSTRRSVRLAGKQQESSTQEDEKSGTLTFDAVSEETDESLEVNSKNEELDKSGIDLKAFESLDINNESDTTACAQPESGNDLVVVALDTNAEEGSEEVALEHNNSDMHTSEMKVLENGKEMASGEMRLDDVAGAKIEVSGEEPMDESEIDHAEAKEEKDFQNKSQNLGDDTNRDSDVTNVVLTKQLYEQDEHHCGDTSDFVAENDEDEEDNLNQVNEGAECNSDVAGEQELIGEPEVEAKVSASKQKCLTNMQANIDSLEVNLFGQFKNEVEEYGVSLTEANVDTPADALEVSGEEPMEESEVDYAKATVESAAQQCLNVPEANTEVAGEEPMEESEIDHAEANVDASHASLIPNAALEPGQIIVTDNKENLVCAKENKGTAGNDNKQSLQDLSLRQLTKMLKELKIAKAPNGKEAAQIKAASSRSALQKLPGNRLTSETEN